MPQNISREEAIQLGKERGWVTRTPALEKLPEEKQDQLIEVYTQTGEIDQFLDRLGKEEDIIERIMSGELDPYVEAPATQGEPSGDSIFAPLPSQKTIQTGLGDVHPVLESFSPTEAAKDVAGMAAIVGNTLSTGPNPVSL